jgi:hypothetical protein
MEMKMKSNVTLAGVFGTAAVLIVVAVVINIWEQKSWNDFAAAHDCQVVGEIAGHSAYGYYNGKYQSYWVPSKTVYKCNDGIEYTR